jgi:hypothetical protein
VLGLLAFLAGAAPAYLWAQADLPEGVEVLARGPVHEAFATPTDPQPQPGTVVPKQPPAPVEEQPPDQRPEGDHVVWIPGYWAWSADTEGFLWVSGIWREAPPGRRWVPGAWQKVDDQGWRWISGFWAPSDLDSLQYVPAPPETLEQGPAEPAPDANSTYVPGCWIWSQTRFLWRPGFWMPYQPGWVWTPACYKWTPLGCLFSDGFWDHPLHDRGLLFAPIRFAGGFPGRGWTYRPSYVVQPDALLGALFVRTGHRHYFFGDFFEPRYRQAGFVPWVDYHPVRNLPDANFAYYRSEFGRAGRWDESLRALYSARQRGEIARPPHTFAQQTQVIQNLTVQNRHNTLVNQTTNLTHLQNVSVLAPLSRVGNTKVTALGGLAHPGGPPAREVEPRKVLKLQALDAERHKQASEQARGMREIGVQRQQQEAKPRVTTPVRPPEARPPAGTPARPPEVHHPATPAKPPEVHHPATLALPRHTPIAQPPSAPPKPVPAPPKMPAHAEHPKPPGHQK